jgi:hypothetical protein
MNDAECAVVKVQCHRETVVCIEFIFTDPVAGCLVEGFAPAEYALDIKSRAIAREIENVNSDVTQHSVRAVAA